MIVPTYNEVGGLEEIVARIRAAVPLADVLIVDDASPDGTGALADRLADADGAIRVLHRAGKEGLGKAYLAGFAIALGEGYEFVVEIDADGSHDPAELPRMLELARAGADLVIGSRWTPGGAVRNWAGHPAGDLARGQRLLAHGAAVAHPGHHGRVPRLPHGDAARPPTWRRSRHRATASRWNSRGAPNAPAAASSNTRSCSWSARPAARRCTPASSPRRWSGSQPGGSRRRSNPTRR